MKVLVIDDDVDVAGFLSLHLPSYGFAVDVVHIGASGISHALVNEYDLILLDMHLPDMAGETVIEKLRDSGVTSPILMLTVVSDASSKARTLNAGADDHLAKPFAFEELVARMRALLRRAPQAAPDVLYARDLVLDTHTRIVERAGKEIPLTRKEFSLLECLLRHKGVLISKATLIEHAWDSSSNSFSAAIETHMTNLRKKVGPDIIETVHSRGYIVRA